MGLRTIVLKLHKPSKAKQGLINAALADYGRAFAFLADKAGSALDEITAHYKSRSGSYSVLSVARWLDGAQMDELNRFNVQPFKDALRLDFASFLANQLRCRKKSWAAKSPQSLYFCRYDWKRGYCLVYNQSRDKFYAKLYLMNRASGRPPVPTDESGRLVHVHRSRQPLARNGRKETFILVPLSFGKTQEAILKEAAQNPESFKTARLFVRRGDYYLSISLETGAPSPVEIASYMGVSRGLKNDLVYTVVDLEGHILLTGVLDTGFTAKDSSRMPLSKLHQAANSVVSLAWRHKAQVVVQNLTRKGDRLAWTDSDHEQYSPVLGCKAYNRLAELLRYKLTWKGLPEPVKVSSTGLFYTCSSCGLHTLKNRQDEALFLCTGCGSMMPVESLGSLNLSRKLLTYKASRIRIRVVRKTDGVLFVNEPLGLNCFCGPDADPMEHLKQELHRIVQQETAEEEDVVARTASRKSLILRLKYTDNPMDILEFMT